MQTKKRTYYDKLKTELFPKLREIDIFLKTGTPPFDKEDVAKLLYISREELSKIMRTLGITEINGYTFYKIMEHGQSPLCRIFARELSILGRLGKKGRYSPQDIAYIYGIEEKKVLAACARAGISSMNETLSLILLDNIEI
ncbi:MAG: hypothetical protein IJC39_00875 [Firmicutes bacterium]|nr:hypothetical protein [Bacillota bacterium]